MKPMDEDGDRPGLKVPKSPQQQYKFFSNFRQRGCGIIRGHAGEPQCTTHRLEGALHTEPAV